MGNTYNVGDIEIGVKVSDKNSISNIDTLIKKLNQLNAIDKKIQDSFISINKLGNGLDKIRRLDMRHIISQFGEIEKATRSLNEKLGSIEQPKFGETAQALNRLGNAFRQFDKLKNFDFSAMEQSFNKINLMITPFLEKLKESEASLVAMSNVLNKLKEKTITKANVELSKTEKITRKTKENSLEIKNNFKNIINIGKLYLIYNYLKRIMGGVAKIVNTAINFEETLNKFQVSFNTLSDDATKFVEKMANGFNLSRQSLMDYMGTFNSMIKSLGGVSGETASGISKTLTQLALDYSSLFNVTVEQAMTSFQSVLSGQIRTIRSISGIDVSENTIFQYYQELGGTKSMRQLSQLEKRLLRIYALEKQMDSLGAINDLQKTMDSTSNMLKQIKETWSETFVYMGNIALKIFKPLTEKALAVSLTIKEMSKSLAVVLEATTKEYPNNSANTLFGEMDNEANQLMEDTNELLGLLSFDRFEALSKNSAKDNGFSIDALSIANAIKQYQTDFDNIKSSAKEISESMLSWLGYKYDEDTGGWILKNGVTRIELITFALRTLIGLGIGKLVGSLATKLVLLGAGLDITSKGLKEILLTSKMLSSLAIIEGVYLLFKGINEGNTSLYILGTTLVSIGATLKLIQALKITNSVFDSSLATAIYNITRRLGKLGSAIMGVSIGLALVGASVYIFNQMDSWSAKTKILVGTLGTLATALLIGATAWLTYHGAMTMGVAIPVILGSLAVGVATITAMVKGFKEIRAYASGGIIEQGQLFIANEKGPELVGTMGGSTTVANNQQIIQGIEQGCYRGFIRAMNTSNGNNVTLNFNVTDGEIARVLFNPMIEEAKRNGYNISKA